MTITTNGSQPSGEAKKEPKRLNKDFGVYLILKSRFEEPAKLDKKVLFKRKDDFIKDLNLNLLTGKITKSTYYFDEESRQTQIELIRALEAEPGSRDPDQCNAIEPFLKSMKFFKQYSEFKKDDFASILQDIKLHKVRRGTKICNFGDNADTIYCVVTGRVAITHPKERLVNLKYGDPKIYKHTVEVMNERETQKKLKLKTFITSQGSKVAMGLDPAHDREVNKNQRI